MMERIITVDIGGTNIKSALFEDGNIVRTDEIPTEAEYGAQRVIEKVDRKSVV